MGWAGVEGGEMEDSHLSISFHRQISQFVFVEFHAESGHRAFYEEIPAGLSPDRAARAGRTPGFKDSDGFRLAMRQSDPCRVFKFNRLQN